MPRYDLHRIPRGGGYLLNLQHDLHAHLSTRVVAPLLPAAGAPPPARGLNPQFELEDGPHILFPQFMAAVPKRELGPVVGTLDAHRDDITRALDLLLTGF
ncbi:plasmid maintenance protein CcdB [Falsiroseomonas bella]|uniref:Toxin CcdB n=1 Tax=Falsiroseomonas bella TaxID=2184016 RepID=A0A317FK10_9PROT|nr:CcdB family protein [Falsiroseomonas bella]PWS38289.1 plasmid maintenance protein CcdB [Falsiroseomonas bella]